MADPLHLEILLEGVKVWNQWRKENADIRPNLRDANLQDVDLQDAKLHRVNLRDTNLQYANLRRANFHQASLRNANLRRANLKNVNLDSADLRSANLQRAEIQNAYLSNVRLNSADLQYANLFRVNLNRANLYQANFFHANLRDARLMRVQALNSNFENSNLTGACIEDWNINSETVLQNVKCEYFYLKSAYYEEYKKLVFTDRRPHDPGKIFAPGEFAQLFHKALETVDLIFSEGIEWAAFLESFQQLQAEVKSEDLGIQAIEKKSGGAFVVRLEVPEAADKAEIEKYIKQEYDTKLKVIEANYQKQLEEKNETIQTKNEELIKSYREKGTDLLEMARIMSSVQQHTVINNNPSLYNQNGKFGIGHNEADILGNTQLGGEINEVGQLES